MKTSGKNIWKKHLEKILLIPLIILFSLMCNSAQAQLLRCGTDENVNVYGNITLGQPQTTFAIPNNYTITPKKFRIKFWKIQAISDSLKVKVDDDSIYRKKDDVSAYGMNFDLATKHIKALNNYYKDHSICFVLEGIGVMKTDSAYTRRDLNNFLVLKQHAIDKNAHDPNAINVYIFKEYGSYGAGWFGNNCLTLLEEPMYHIVNSPYNVLAHEIGHNFGLEHTHYGNRPNAGICYMPAYYSGNCEHVTRNPNDPNYNALTHGDKVHDTAADPGLFSLQTGDYANCYNQDANCNYIGNQVDCMGTPYVLDNSVLRNIMSYGSTACATDFTPGQRTRIHYLIDNDDITTGISYAPLRATLVQPNNLGGFDLMVRNSHDDYGVEPDTASTQNFWTSPDVWVRNANDNGIYHENPEYGNGNNYIKVRVVNRGCATSAGEGKLKLYWTKAGTNLPMDVWEGGNYNVGGHPLGGLIGEVNLPALDSYEEHVFTFPWTVPNPANYSTINEPWHFCLLAKIDAPNDVSLLPQDNGIYYHFLNSNNIALKNVSVVDNVANKSGKIHIGNFEGGPRNFKIKFRKDRFYSANTNIFNEAEIKLTFDSKLWNIWQSSGFQGSNFSNFGDNTIIINENTEIILNNFPPHDFGLLNVKVNFLTNAYTNNEQFGFNVEHWDNDTNELMGGELYLVNKNQRDLFNADAFVNNNILQAVSINEPAVYNWYDTNGTLLHTGQNYTVSNTNGTYLLEVVANYDGYKDMKEVTVTPNNGLLLHNIYPNPATSNVTIQYNQLNCNNAYLMLVNISSNASANYILNLNNTSININTGQYAPGVYRVVLVCDNNIIESHNLLIQ